MRQASAVASESVARSSPTWQMWASPPPLPSGLSRLWSGPATKPSSEIDMWQVVSGIESSLGSVQAGRGGYADDGSLGRAQAGDDLAPRLLAGRVQEVVSGGRELLRGGVQRVPVGDLELDADLRRRQVLGPLVLAEAGLGGLGQRPDAEMPRPLD